jgi:hypothetical protein
MFMCARVHLHECVSVYVSVRACEIACVCAYPSSFAVYILEDLARVSSYIC